MMAGKMAGRPYSRTLQIFLCPLDNKGTYNEMFVCPLHDKGHTDISLYERLQGHRGHVTSVRTSSVTNGFQFYIYRDSLCSMNHTILIHDLKEKLLEDVEEAHAPETYHPPIPCNTLNTKKSLNSEELVLEYICEQRRKARLST